MSTNNDNTIVKQEGEEPFEEETPNKVKKVELEIQSDKDDSSTGTNSDVGKISTRFSCINSQFSYYFSSFPSYMAIISVISYTLLIIGIIWIFDFYS